MRKTRLSEDAVRGFFQFFDIEDEACTRAAFAACCEYWNLTDEDLDRALERAARYHRTALPSMRRILGIYLREWMAPFDSTYQKHVYYNVPGTITFMYFLREILGTEESSAYVGSPDFISMVVLYGIFGRKTRIETGSCRHCAVNLMRAALAEDPAFSAADLQVSFGFTCDEAPRQDAILRSAGKDVLRLFVMNPVRSEKSPAYIEERLRELLLKAQEKFGISPLQKDEKFDVSPMQSNESFGISSMQKDVRADTQQEVYRVCKSARFRLAVKVHQIIDYVRSSGFFWVTNNDIVFLESLLITSFQCGMQELEETLTKLFEEIKKDTSEDVRKVRHRFCVYYTPICNPEYGEIMEENGIALLDHTAFSNSAMVTGSKDPCEDASLEAMGMLIAGPAREEGEKIAELIRRKKLDGFVSGMFAFDRWMGMQQYQLKTIIEERTGKTVFLYDTDFWNQESFARNRMETAVETLTYML